MSTTTQVIEWLKQFPPDTKVTCLEAYDNGGWEGGKSVYHKDFLCQDASKRESAWTIFETFELNHSYDKATDTYIVTEILIGKSD